MTSANLLALGAPACNGVFHQKDLDDVDPVAGALREYAGPRDGGIRDEGPATGVTYT